MVDGCTAVDRKFCGTWFGKEPITCKVNMINQDCKSGVEQKTLEGFNEDYDCAKSKEYHCRWQIHEGYLSLYNPNKKKNKYERRNYYVNKNCL